MPRLCPCPRCFRDLTIPDLPAEVTQLMCPFCREEFGAAEVQGSGDPLPPVAILLTAQTQASVSAALGGEVPAPTGSLEPGAAAPGEPASVPGAALGGDEPQGGLPTQLSPPLPTEPAQFSAAPQPAHAPAAPLPAHAPAAPQPAPAGEAATESVLGEGYDPLTAGAYAVPAATSDWEGAAGAVSPGEPRFASAADHAADANEGVLDAPAGVSGSAASTGPEPRSPWSDVPTFGELATGDAAKDEDYTPSPHQAWWDDSGSHLAPTAEASPEPSPYEPPGDESPTHESPPQTTPSAVDLRTVSRPRRHSSAFGQMLGVVAGGALGVAIGYYLLVLILGARGDFLELRSKLPWLLPGERPDPKDEQDSDARDGRRPSRGPAGQRTRSRRGAARPQPVHVQPLLSARAGMVPQMLELGPAAAPSQTPSNVAGWADARFTPLDIEHRAVAVAVAVGCPRFSCAAGSATLASGSESREPAGPVPCAACRAGKRGPLSLRAYVALCRLAEAVTLARVCDEEQRGQLRTTVCGVLACVAAVPGRLPTIGRLAAQHMRSSHAQGHGVVLAGTVRAIGQDAERFVLTMVLFGEPMVVTVAAQTPPTTPIVPGDRVLVLGCLQQKHATDERASRTGHSVWGGLCHRMTAVDDMKSFR